MWRIRGNLAIVGISVCNRIIGYFMHCFMPGIMQRRLIEISVNFFSYIIINSFIGILKRIRKIDRIAGGKFINRVVESGKMKTSLP